MKILHYRNNYLPLSETFIYAYLVHFTRVEPLVVCRRLLNAEHFPFRNIQQTSSGSRIIDQLSSRFGIESFRYRKIARIVAAEEVKLVHAHFGVDACDLLDIPALRSLPMVTSFYGYDASTLARDPVWRQRYERLFARGEAFIVEGGCMKGRLEALGCPSEKIQIIRIGIAPDRYRFRARTRQAGRPVRILFCGRFVEKKGLLLALSAITKLGLRSDEIEFRIIGDGEQKKQILEYVRSNRMEGLVVFLGMLPHAKVIEEMEGCDILLQPSQTAENGDSEGGAPTVLLEAQASGVPIVSTRHADIPEVVLAGESALLAREGDVDDIAAALETMLATSHLWAEMGRSGRAWVERHHDIKVVTAQLEELYFGLVPRFEMEES